MGRSRSRSRGYGRSRSRGRGGYDRRDGGNSGAQKTVEEVSKLAKEGNSESDIVNVAIKQLPQKIRERLEKLFEEGLLKENDLDLRSITVFASLNEGLQDRVMTHMENERIYVANARSKSGFLIATCDKAKTGCLDARGLGAIDPWRSALVAMATPKQKMIDLEPERDWLDKYPDPIKLHINVAVAEREVGMPKVTVEVPLSETAATVKSKLSSMGIQSIPVNKMKLHNENVGFLKDRNQLAYYNLTEGTELELQVRQRAGVKTRKDHAVPLKRPRTQERQAAAAAAEAAKAPAAKPALPDPKPGGLPGLPGGLPGLPGLPSLPGLPGAGAPKLPGLPGLGGLTGPGGLPGLPGLGGSGPGGLPGLAGGLPPGLGGLTLPGLPKLPGGLPGMPPGLPKLPGMPDLSSMMRLPGMPDLSALAKPASPAGLPGPGGAPGMPDIGALMAKMGMPPGLSLPGLRGPAP